jgi:hypothetical protein
MTVSARNIFFKYKQLQVAILKCVSKITDGGFSFEKRYNEP